MSRDDLEWVFGGEVDFVEAESKQPLLSLEVPLLGFAGDLSRFTGQIRSNGRYEIPDRYGSYRLIVTVKENCVNVRDADRAFEAEGSQLTSAIREFFKSLSERLTQLFPELRANPEFNSISREISDRFSADQHR
jgi:hypothetical protein